MEKEHLELLSSEALIPVVKEQTDNLILYFSCGKDSIAMWLYLQDKGFNIHPVYLYTVPGLRSDDENLEYYEKFFGQKIMRLPHPLFYQMLNDLVYQPPERVATILSWNLPEYRFADIDEVIAYDLQLDNYYSAMGMRMADNLDRRMMMYQNGVLGSKARKFYYAVWDWNVEQVAGIIRRHKCKIPKAYQFSGRTIAALDYFYMRPFRECYPDDYEKILEWFPLLDAEFYRYERLANGKEDCNA